MKQSNKSIERTCT